MTTNTYLFKEGYDNLRKHGSKTLSTLLIICATMIVLGIFLVLFQNVNKNVEVVRKEQGLQALIEDAATEADIEYMKDQIKLIDGVKEIKYLDKEAAFQDAKNIFAGSEYWLEGLEDVKPFPASFIVKFKDINQSKTILEKVKKIDGIYDVKYNEKTIEAIKTVSNIANIFLIGIGSVMLIVSIFIISNTIKLAVYSNKREIFIMKYIGATDKFIRRPFIVEGALLGFTSAVVSFITISIAYVVLYARMPKIGSSLGVFGFMSYSSLWWQILIVYVVLGLTIGILGSVISIKKYLKV